MAFEIQGVKGTRRIGSGESVFVVAELGINHNGSLTRALEMVREARRAGADAIKLQSFKVEKLLSVENDPELFEMFKSWELSFEDQEKVFKEAEKEGLFYFSTPFDEESARFLKEVGVPMIKVASGDITNLPFLSFLADLKLPLVVSTGASRFSEVAAAVELLRDKRADFILLHCVSSYPAEVEELNLKSISSMREAFKVDVGFSDHTFGVLASVAAVALGAVMIEKHFTLSRNLPGPDHPLSLEPFMFQEFVRAIRDTEKALGDGFKRPSEHEELVGYLGRRSLAFKKDKREGELISEDDITFLRPATGIPPALFKEIVGFKLVKSAKKGEILKWSHIKGGRES